MVEITEEMRTAGAQAFRDNYTDTLVEVSCAIISAVAPLIEAQVIEKCAKVAANIGSYDTADIIRALNKKSPDTR